MLIVNQKKQRGQGMVEYIIIVALIALAAIAAFSYFGDSVRGQTAQMASQVAGNSNNNGIQQSNNAAGQAQNEATSSYDLGNYNKAGKVNN